MAALRLCEGQDCDEPVPPEGGQCKWCGHDNPPADGPPDGTDMLSPPGASAKPDSVAEAQPGHETARAGRTGAGGTRCDHSGAEPGGVICSDCGEPLSGTSAGVTRATSPVGTAPARVVLELPWGEHALTPGQSVDIGREVAPFERMLEPYGTVGRRHATLRLTPEGRLFVGDQRSTNGTFVDGRRCEPTGEIEVGDGTELWLSTRLRFRVRFER